MLDYMKYEVDFFMLIETLLLSIYSLVQYHIYSNYVVLDYMKLAMYMYSVSRIHNMTVKKREPLNKVNAIGDNIIIINLTICQWCAIRAYQIL